MPTALPFALPIPLGVLPGVLMLSLPPHLTQSVPSEHGGVRYPPSMGTASGEALQHADMINIDLKITNTGIKLCYLSQFLMQLLSIEKAFLNFILHLCC